VPRAARPRSAPTARPPARPRARRPARLLAVAAAVVLGLATTAAFVAVGGAKTARAATTWPAHVFAPYVDTGLSNTTLSTVAADDGTQFFTLAFVNGAGCQWSLPNQSGWQSQVSALQAGGGDVSISFGGYTVDTDATDLGAQCSSASAMAAQVESVVSTFNVSHLDFDIESNEQTDTADLALTAQALALVRSWASANGDALTISYTIPTLPTGFTGEGEGVLTTALANGFTPNIVNIMTMDYGSSGTEMGSAANQALDAAAGQLESIYGISQSAAYAMLGNTPMIGQNDTPGEIFTLADAATVESYAARQGIGWLSFWAEGRDNDGCPGDTTASSTCSGISQSAGAFTQAFQAFTSGGSGGGGTPTPTPTTPTPTPTPTPTTSGSCAAAWVGNIAYVSGNEVSYGGDDWTATQWNYDEVPGGAAGAWTSDGSC
jgi:Glycosyl hydrolases family 18